MEGSQLCEADVEGAGQRSGISSSFVGDAHFLRPMEAYLGANKWLAPYVVRTAIVKQYF